MWSLLLIAVAGAGQVDPATTGPEVASPAATELISAELAADIQALEHPQFRLREEAGLRIVARGKEAVAPLTQLVQLGRAEAVTRAFELLRELHSDQNEDVQEAVDSAYDLLLQSDNVQVVTRAEAAVEAVAVVRHKRALAAFRKLGGLVRFHADEEPEGNAAPLPIRAVMLNRQWKGGDDGLKYLRRIEDFQPVARLQQRTAVYVIKGSSGAKISAEALNRLKNDLPGMVAERGPAFLGIQPGDQVEQGLMISKLVPGGAGDAAGLVPGDVIMKFDGVEIPNFDELVKQIGLHEPHDKVEVLYLREGEEKKVTVELDEFKI